MKRKVSMLALVLLLGILSVGCNDVAGSKEIESDSDSSLSFDDMLVKYQPPVNVVSVDMTADDPSNDEITFNYDDLGRISGYRYKADGMEILTTYDYDYKEGMVWVISFVDATVVNDTTFACEDAPDAGFTDYQGYYFKNVNVSEPTLSE